MNAGPPHTLPIEQQRAPFRSALAAGHVVVEAATGSGKSTRIPLWCAEQGRVLVVEPRRLACRALARHVAQLDGTELGTRIGYAVRFDSRYRNDSAVVFVTPGIALRWFAEDRLSGYRTVLLDEFHERRWDTDLLAALLRHHGRHRVVITSATVEGRRLADYLGAQRIVSGGRLFPVEVRYTDSTELPTLQGLEERVVAAVHSAFAQNTAGDVLVFLPGKGEIRRCANALNGTLDAPLLSLHAGVDAAQQDRILNVSSERRVILATNVAETALTIPGVRVVVDSGLERRSHHRNGRSVLGLHAISDAAAQQRAGRAGRLGPGQCIRLWGAQARLEGFTPPEVMREELDDLLMAAAASGTTVTELVFPDPLPRHAVQRAGQRLRAMGAVSAEGLLTDHGRRLFPLPLDPLFAHLITAMPDTDSSAAMVDLAAALSAQRNPLPPRRTEAQREAFKAWVAEGCEATALIRAVRGDLSDAFPCDRGALDEARRIAAQTRTALALPPLSPRAPLPRESLLLGAMTATPELVFVRRPKRRHAMGNGVMEVELGRDSDFPDKVEAALVFDQHSVPGRGTNQTLNLATCLAPLPLQWLATAGLGTLEHDAPQWQDGEVLLQQRRVYAGRVVAEEQTVARGGVLLEALADLVLNGSLCPPAGTRLLDDVEAWDLYLALDMGDGEPVQPRQWLVERLAGLGIEEAADMMLIGAADLCFSGVPEWERERFDATYPRRVHLPNLELTVHYEPRRKRLTAERTGGSRRKPPGRAELPLWRGWVVRYRDGSRVVEPR